MPDDTTPHGGEALHPLPDRAKIPEPKPDPASDAPRSGEPSESDPAGPDPAALDPAERPQLPEHPRVMPADLQPAAPAGDPESSDASATGKPSVTRQPG